MTAVPFSVAESSRLRGLALVVMASLASSSAGPLFRAIEEASAWQILFWRSFGMLLVVGLYAAVTLRRDVWAATRRLGWQGPLAGAFIAVAFTGFILALERTTVANTLVMLALGPLLSAGMGRLVLGEPVRRATLLAMPLALVGVAVMVWDGFAAGQLSGNLLALLATCGFSAFAVTLRAVERRSAAGAPVDLRPALCMGALIGMAASGGAMAADGQAFLLGPADMGYALALGAVQLGLALVLYIEGAKYLTAAEATLLTMTEVVLGPLWTWLLFAESPTPLGMVGGLVLLSALLLQVLGGRLAGRR